MRSADKKSKEIADGAENDHGAAFSEKVRNTSSATGKKKSRILQMIAEKTEWIILKR